MISEKKELELREMNSASADLKIQKLEDIVQAMHTDMTILE